jgi:hypothetical protein
VGVVEIPSVLENVHEVWQGQQRDMDQAGAGVRNLMPHFILRTRQPPQERVSITTISRQKRTNASVSLDQVRTTCYH